MKNNKDKSKLKTSKNDVIVFEKIKVPFWKVEDLKDITKMAIPIFVQLLFNIIIAQINLIAINWYDGGVYSEAVSKAVLSYNTLQFIPSLISTGTIVVAGNLIGQGRKDEVSRVVVSGLIVNLMITSIIFVFIESFAEKIVKLMEAKDTPIIGANTYEKSELHFVSKYYRFLNINLVLLSVTQVFVAGLQSMKKSLHVTIGAILANVIDLIVVMVILYATNVNPVYSALSLTVTGIFQAIYMMFMNFKFIDFKINKKKQLSWKYSVETIKTGLPITIEMGVWNLCNFATGIAIAKLSTNAPISNEFSWLVLHRDANNIGQYSAAFIQAMGTVTSVFVARKIGANDRQGAYETGINCWKAAIYATLISNIVMICLSWPMLKLLNTPTEYIWPWGITLLLIFSVKLLVDTVNMTLLRALWSAGDLWYPIIISFITMGIGMVAIPFTIVYAFNAVGGFGLIFVYLGIIVDPLTRSIIYIIRWLKGKWQNYIHIID